MMRRLPWLLSFLFSCGDKTNHTTENDTQATINHPDDSSTWNDPEDTGPPTPTGCSAASNSAPLDNTTCVLSAPCQWDGTQLYGNLGFSIDAGGDVDGDGVVDMIVGAPLEDQYRDDADTLLDVGRVHVYLGADRSTHSTSSAVLFGDTEGDYLGGSVSIVPDTNGDGFDEIIAGARNANHGELEAAGVVHLRMGSAEGWNQPTVTADQRWYGQQGHAKAGSQLLGTGDINGDGLGEVMVTTNLKQINSESGYESYAAGQVALLMGQEDFANIDGLHAASATIDGTGATDGAGMSLAAADVNGDGHRDLLIAAPYGHSNRGEIAVFSGGPIPPTGTLTLDDANLSITGTEYGTVMGFTLSAGDIDGDGKAEIAIGLPLSDAGTPDAGAVHIYGGSEVIFDGVPEIAHQFVGEFDDHQLGTGVLIGPDLNGDGVGDLVMGAINTWRGLVTKGGRSYVFHGPRTDWPATVSAALAPIQLNGGATKDYLGRSTTTADINEDGKQDLLIASGYANTSNRNDTGSIYLFFGE